MKADWYAWTITNNRYKRVIEYLEESSIVEDFIYPTVEKEYNTKKGRRKKYIPIYANYIFIKYVPSEANVHHIENCPWILQHVGKCTESEIKSIKELDSKEYDMVVPKEQIMPGTRVKLISTPFDGWEALVVEQVGDKLLVGIKIFGGDRIIQCKMEDVNIV